MAERHRLTRDALYIRVASLTAQRGTCDRLQVGAVITRGNRILATGYNGPPKDEEHCNPFQCNVNEPCKRAIHAEINAIANLPTVPIEAVGDMILYVTHAPCFVCSKEISGFVKEVYFLQEFRDNSGIKNLISKGIVVKKINLNGQEIPYTI